VTALGVSWIELIGRYSVKRLLGSGAFASVWLAHDDLLDVPVAVKVLADNWSVHTDVRARFLTEAKLLRQADSDRVLRVLDIGELPDGRPYFVTSYADGGSLADRLDDAELPLNEALDVLIQVCESVCVLHEMGVVHRDLKPSNVLFKTDNAGRRRLLLADLGIAKALAQGSGLTVMAGSPGYMAPEQARQGAIVDERTDVYGLGAIGFRLLSGHTLTTEPAPALPGRAGQAIRRALEPDPARRWPTARSLADELIDCARAEPRTLAAAMSSTTVMPAVMHAGAGGAPAATGPPTQQLPVLRPRAADAEPPLEEPAPQPRVPAIWIVVAVALLALIAGVSLVFGQRVSPVGTAGPTGAPVRVIDVGDGPNDIAISRLTDRALVTSATGREISVIDTATESVVQVIRLDRYISNVAVTSDGATAYVTNPASDAVLVIDVGAGTVRQTITVGDMPSDILLTDEDRRAWLTNRTSGTVTVIDAERNIVEATIKVGYQPAGLAISAEGREIYVANGGDNSVSIIDVRSRKVTKTVPTGGGGPVDVLLSPKGVYYYLANVKAGTVSVLERESNRLVATVELGGEPLRLASDGELVYATNGKANAVAVISADGQLLESRPVGARPIGIAVSPDGEFAYVANSESDSVSVLDIRGER